MIACLVSNSEFVHGKTGISTLGAVFNKFNDKGSHKLFIKCFVFFHISLVSIKDSFDQILAVGNICSNGFSHVCLASEILMSKMFNRVIFGEAVVVHILIHHLNFLLIDLEF